MSGPEDTAAMDDRKLVDQVLEGDDGAFRMLAERYQQVVAATVIGMLGPGDDAEDVGQETFIRFYKALGTFRGDASVKTFLTRIAINLSLNSLKRKRRMARRLVSRDQASSPLPEPTTNGAASVESREVQDAVAKAIQQLNPKQRAVVVLRMIEGYSTKETAEILEIPEGTVLSRLARGMDALKPLLHIYGEDHER